MRANGIMALLSFAIRERNGYQLAPTQNTSNVPRRQLIRQRHGGNYPQVRSARQSRAVAWPGLVTRRRMPHFTTGITWNGTALLVLPESWTPGPPAKGGI